MDSIKKATFLNTLKYYSNTKQLFEEDKFPLMKQQLQSSDLSVYTISNQMGIQYQPRNNSSIIEEMMCKFRAGINLW